MARWISSHTPRRFLVALLAALLAGGLAACGGALPPGQTPSVTASAQRPADWPKQVPFYDEGTLFAASVQPSGEAGALWEVQESDRSKVADDYGRQLAKAGFRSTDWFQKGAMSGFIYRGHGMTVTVGTLESEGVTQLDVYVEP